MARKIYIYSIHYFDAYSGSENHIFVYCASPRRAKKIVKRVCPFASDISLHLVRRAI